MLFVLVSSQLLSNDSFTVSQPPSPQPVEENSIDQGFHLFLNVLNKGVDVGLLRIVNDDPGDLCLDNKLHKIQQHEATDASFRERQYSNDGNSVPEHSGSGGSSTDPCSQERSHTNPRPENEEKEEVLLILHQLR